MELIQKLNWRYATKRMNGREVPQEKLDNILEAIRLSASSAGLQPYKVFVIKDAATKEKLRKAAFDQPQLTEASHVIVFAWRNWPALKGQGCLQGVTVLYGKGARSANGARLLRAL